MTLKRVCLLAFLAALALVPATAGAATAGHHPAKISLALVPLQTAQLGPDGASFALNYGSGPGADDTLQVFGAFSLNGVRPPSPIGGPHISGYALDYGDPFTGSTGVMEIRTGVEQYKSPAYAKSGLKFWRHTESTFWEDNSAVLPITGQWLEAPSVGQRGFASLTTFAAPNLNPIVRLDEQVADGRYVLDLTVTAGSASAAKQAAPGLLSALDHRLRKVVAGHWTGYPAKLPPRPDGGGQAPGGPDLSAATLQPSDVGQSHWVSLFQDYEPDSLALSSFFMYANPAGPYSQLTQDIRWWPTATEATYAETYQADSVLVLFGGATSVDLSGLSDPASGTLITGSGLSQSVVEINLTNGQAGDSVFAESDQMLTTSDVQTLAQALATRLDAALGP
jgi:hypothetical protein